MSPPLLKTGDESMRIFRLEGRVISSTISGGTVVSRFERRNSIGELFSWAEELTSGKSVVKLWENLGLGFGLDLDESDDVFNVYDVNRETIIGSIFGGKSNFQAVSSSSSTVVVSAGADSSTGRVAFSAWDTRLHCRQPTILAEWSPEKPMERISAVNADGVEKVYIRDDVTGKLTVGDMRKANSSLRNVTDSDVDTWWDADAVLVLDESIDESG
ncbi:hypothetical protein F3Y22_tig00003041pilonHSYRG01262 [Hibiscus syriacus]|uniref:Uncharacterized protein n=1 Tax=Hibiscus syriacus TaxID=106335 RepID=A0A6A3CMC2_HIBSY|nr:hypothetical protein F3Y22_tig00003041pilonHSYRG01262 [Hibiscus syriacus]